MTKTVILVRRPFGKTVYYLENKYGGLLQFNNIQHVRREWKQTLFKNISPVKKELYEKIMIAWFDAKIVSVNLDTLAKSASLLAKLESPFFDIFGREIKEPLANELWGNSEPLVRNVHAKSI